MICRACLYETNCKLKEIAPDITGCEGHSKEKPPIEGYLKCYCCRTWNPQNRMFKHKYDKERKSICFDCF